MSFDSTDILLNPAMVHKKRSFQKVKRACDKGLYLSPTTNQVVDSSQPMTISWDPTCFTPAPSTVDIYMTAPYAQNPNIYTWLNVDYASGTYNATLKPKWWNSTDAVTLQLNIIQSGVPSFLTQFPAGPLFNATYNPATAATNTGVAAAANTALPDTPYTSVNNAFHTSGLSKGKLAAAVLMPLLTVFGGIAVYVWYSRKKEKVKRNRWSQAMDSRMSTISGDWKSMTGAGANHAIRQSMALSGDRGTKASSFFAGNGPAIIGRPSSAFTDAGSAGVGARYNGIGLGGSLAASDNEMVQIRPPGTASTPAARVSRVSFALDAHPRPSMGERSSVYTNGTSRASRAYHRGTVYDDSEVPPLPNSKSTDDVSVVSPTQADGPPTLTPSEIRARISAAVSDNDAGRPSLDEGLLRLPAMSMMRTSEASPEPVLAPKPAMLAPSRAESSAPEPSPTPVSSNFNGMGALPGSATSATMSPDDMLKAYAAVKKWTALAPKKGPSVEITNSANGGMRTLYTPTTASSNNEQSSVADTTSYYGTNHGHSDSLFTEEGVVVSARRSTPGGEDHNPFRKSQAVSQAYDDIDPFQGEAH